MTLEAVFKDLSKKWQTLHDQLVDDLLWSVTETKPDEDHTLANYYMDGTTDLISEVKRALGETKKVAEGQPNLAQASQVLMCCQECYHYLTKRLLAEFLSYQRIKKLMRFGKERGNGWRDWAAQMRNALDRCRQPLEDVNQSLFHCWQEVADRVGMTSVSVQASSVGQHIALQDRETEPTAKQAIT